MPPTPILEAKLQVAGECVVCDSTKLELIQPTDFEGRPNGKPTLGVLEVTLSGPAAFLPVWQSFNLDDFRRESGDITWRTDHGQTVRHLIFLDAPCTNLGFELDATGHARPGASALRLRFSPAAIELDGVYVEFYSRLSWEKNAAVRHKALLLPMPLRSPPLPPPRLLPPELPPLPPGTLGPLVGRLLGLAGLLLTPANDADAPGYDADRDIGKLNSPIDKDAARLAYLERERGSLSAEEEAECVALLAKVKGVHGVEPGNIHTFNGNQIDLDQCPITIPAQYDAIEQNKTGYDQVKFKWSDGTHTYEARWHTRTPNAPIDQGDTWVITRTTPGNAQGQRKSQHILTGQNQWTPATQWQSAVLARQSGNATPLQEKMLDSGHWTVKK